MSRLVGRSLVLVASIVYAAVAAAPAAGQSQQGESHATISGVAAQLGIKAQGPDGDDMRIGTSFTAVLEQPEKLAELGIAGMHAGARVTVARVAPDKVRVEADELDPVSHSAAVNLRLGANGELSKIPKS